MSNWSFTFWGLKHKDGKLYWVKTVSLHPNFSLIYKEKK